MARGQTAGAWEFPVAGQGSGRRYSAYKRIWTDDAVRSGFVVHMDGVAGRQFASVLARSRGWSDGHPSRGRRIRSLPAENLGRRTDLRPKAVARPAAFSRDLFVVTRLALHAFELLFSQQAGVNSHHWPRKPSAEVATSRHRGEFDGSCGEALGLYLRLLTGRLRRRQLVNLLGFALIYLGCSAMSTYSRRADFDGVTNIGANYKIPDADIGPFHRRV